MADALDSKSSDRKIVWVQVPPPAPEHLNLDIACAVRPAHLISAPMPKKFVLVGFAIATISALAASGSSTLQGVVKDSKGQPVSGAEVHVQSKDGSIKKIVRTDANGRYAVTKLPAADYEAILFVDGKIKTSINNTRVLADKPTQLDFTLTGRFTANQPAKKHTHMVYVPPETGSHLGGRWVEVDDSGNNGAATATMNNVKTSDGSVLKNMQSNSGAMPSGLGGSP